MERVVEATGFPGTQGADGRGFSEGTSASGSGAHGGPGEDGRDGKPGGPGGEIKAHIASQPSGTTQLKTLVNGEKVTANLNFEEGESLFLSVRGGDGGRGGHGGRGQDGARGYRGKDANRYRSGTDGGPGGDGGGGGDSGRGGDAGPGGRISLSVGNADLDLLLGVRWEVSGGTPGTAGIPGNGGRGGSGGAGGSSYSWTETEYYTDSQGKQQSRTRFRSNPGGSTGRGGRAGGVGSRAEDGSRAKDGFFELELDKARYSDRYRFRCVSYSVEPGEKNGVFEFGEQNNLVRDLVVRNLADCPSPKAYVSAELTGDEMVEPASEAQAIPSLHPHSPKHALEPFRFHLGEALESELPSTHQRLKRSFLLEPRLYFERLARFDPEFHQARELELTFPVELETEVAATSLAAGVSSRQRWRVVNHGTKVFPPPGREVKVHLRTPHNGAKLQVLRETGELFEVGPESREFQSIRDIPPGGSVTVTASLTASSEAEPYCKSTLVAELYLTPCGGGEPRLIQQNPVEYAVAFVQEPKEADVCLLTHHGCTREEVRAWLDLLEKLGLSVTVWDLSYHGDWPVERLSQCVEGRLTVVLHSSFLSPERTELTPLDFLSGPAYRRSISQQGVSYYFVGEPCDRALERLVPNPKEGRRFSSITEYLKAQSAAARHNPEVPESMERVLEQIAVSRFFVAGKPRPDYLEKRAKDLLGKLRKKFPQQRFLVTTVFEPSDDERWFRNKSCGVLEVRRMPDTDARAVVTRQVQRVNAVRSEFLHSVENLLGLFSAQDFDDKLRLLEGLTRESGEWSLALEALADAFLLDFSAEQLSLRSSGVRLGRRGLGRALNRSVAFCRHDFRAGERLLDPSSLLGRFLAKVVGGLDFLSSSQMAWYDHRVRFLGGTNDVDITVFMRRESDRLLDKNFGSDRLWGTGAARKAVEAQIENVKRELRERQELILEHGKAGVHRKYAAGEALVQWELRDFLRSDSETDSGLWSQDEMEMVKSRETEQELRLSALLELYGSAQLAAQL